MSERVEAEIIQQGNPWRPQFTSLRIRKTLDEICHWFELRYPLKVRSRLAAHQRVTIWYTRDGVVNERAVARGFIDDVTIDTSSKEANVVVTGRSDARDIVDSKWSDTIKNRTLFSITKDICATFGMQDFGGGTNCWHIDNVAGPDPTKVIEEFSFENESPWEKLLLAADTQGFILSSSQSGGLYIWNRAKSPRMEGFKITEGMNVKTISGVESGRDQFYQYVFRAGDGVSVTGYDRTCPNRRILTVNVSDSTIKKADLQKMMETDIRRRRSVRNTFRLPGWGLTEKEVRDLGNLDKKEIFWEPNFLIPVKLPELGIDDRLLTSTVEYYVDDKSMSCDVEVARPEEFD